MQEYKNYWNNGERGWQNKVIDSNTNFYSLLLSDGHLNNRRIQPLVRSHDL